MDRRLLVSLFLLSLSLSSNGVAKPNEQDEILIAGNFKIDIAGASSCDAVSFDADPIEIEMEDDRQGNDPQWRTIRPGTPRFGQARFSFRADDQKCNQDLRDWIHETTTLGDKARRSISIVLLDRNGKEARRYSLNDSYPLALAPEGSRQLTNVACAACRRFEPLSQLTVQIGSVDTSAQTQGGSTGQDQILRYKGFNVEIKGVDGAPTQVDSSWQSVTGGSAEMETVEATTGSDGSRHYTPGKAYVSELTLAGYMTKTRKALLQWMQNSAKGTGELRRDLVITVEGARPIDPPLKYHYFGCLITRIRIPSLNSGSSDPVKEVVTLRPTRYNDPA